jgi:hypothetical protein
MQELNVFHAIGIGYTGYMIYTNMDFVVKLFYLVSLYGGLFVFGYTTSKVLIISYENFVSSKTIEEEPDDYDVFLNKEYDTLIDIYENEQEQEYTNKDESFIKELCDTSNHFKSDLPFYYNKEIILFYNHDDESYHYFTQHGDVNYNVLNSVCRSYVLKHKCLNLFNDENDLKMIHQKESEEEEEKEEEKETLSGISSLFYKKKTKITKKTKPETKSINKFIYKGSLDEYDKLYKIENRNQSNIDYETFKQNYESSL